MKPIYLNDEKTSMLQVRAGISRKAVNSFRQLACSRQTLLLTDRDGRLMWENTRLFAPLRDAGVEITDYSTGASDLPALLLAVGGCELQASVKDIKTEDTLLIRIPTDPVAMLRYLFEAEPTLVLMNTACMRGEPRPEDIAELVRLSVCMGEGVLPRLYGRPDYDMILLTLAAGLREAAVLAPGVAEFALREAAALQSIDSTLTHSEAVALATVMLVRASERWGVCRRAFANRVTDILTYRGLPHRMELTGAELLGALAPYAADGELTLLLCTRMGQCEEHRIKQDDIPSLFGLE